MTVKVSVHENPVAAATKAARFDQALASPNDVVITDINGRRLTIREPNLLQESRLVRALGDDSNNVNYLMVYAMPAAMVVKVDDNDMVFPHNQITIDAAIGILGREGHAAVMEYITEKAKEKKAAEESYVGKSDGTPNSGKPAG